MEKLRYKKISEFLEDLNPREKKYILKKVQQDISQDSWRTKFTIIWNGETYNQNGNKIEKK